MGELHYSRHRCGLHFQPICLKAGEGGCFLLTWFYFCQIDFSLSFLILLLDFWIPGKMEIMLCKKMKMCHLYMCKILVKICLLIFYCYLTITLPQMPLLTQPWLKLAASGLWDHCTENHSTTLTVSSSSCVRKSSWCKILAKFQCKFISWDNPTGEKYT